MRMPCARAAHPAGPYEVNLEISADEDFGLREGPRLKPPYPPFDVVPADPSSLGRMSLHQGGIVDTPAGEWWGFSMMDYNSVGRLTCLSPITWQDGWPYFGLPGNLKRTPRIWAKPNTGHGAPPSAPFQRNDDFSVSALNPLWQWNHLPDDTKWSLAERPGHLRLYSMPAADLWWARNTLTQRAIGPESSPTVELDTSGMQAVDVAGLALLNLPYAWIGVCRQAGGLALQQFDQATGRLDSLPLDALRVWLRARCDFLTEQAAFSYSTDGSTFQPLGQPFAMIFQLKTFQGVRYALFHYNSSGAPGGYADFARFTVEQPHPRGLRQPIPFGKTIMLATFGGARVLVVREGVVMAVPADNPLAHTRAAHFGVADCGYGRVALQGAGGLVSVVAPGGSARMVASASTPTDAEMFQWTETPYGDLVLLSLVTHRHLRVDLQTGAVAADWPGPLPSRNDGACLSWEIV
jgi:hypothetical protein